MKKDKIAKDDNKKKWRKYAAFILLTEAVSALAGILTKSAMPAYEQALKPPLTPPSAVFPVVWVILFALLGIGAARVCLSPPSKYRRAALAVFWVQLVFNFLWSLIFFNLQAYGMAFFWLVALWLLILLMTVLFAKVDKAAAWLQTPYLLWVAFAGYLNLMVWLLNR